MKNISDTPISAVADDLYSVAPFAHALAKTILQIDGGEGTVIALNGPWGSGKSSIVNLVRKEIESAVDERKQVGAPELVVTEFRSWWFRGDEAVTLAFLTHMTKMFEASFKERAAGIGRTLTRHLSTGVGGIAQLAAVATLGLTPVAGIAAKAGGDAAAAATKYLSDLLADDEGLEAAFKKLRDLLENQTEDKKRFLVVIDDIDRLTPDEAISVFRLVKSVGHLPNVTYLLAFDRDLSEKAVERTYPSEGPHFLEKIVQTSFDVPMPLRTDLNAALLKGFDEILEQVDERALHRLLNLFHGIVTHYVPTPRHVARLLAALSVRWPAVKGEINVSDFIVLETLRLNERAVYNAIIEHKEEVCGCTDQVAGRRGPPKWMQDMLGKLGAERRDVAREALTELFPRLDNVGHGTDFLAGWNADRRVCIEAHLNTYLSAGLSSEVLSKAVLDEMIAKSGDAEFVKNEMRRAKETMRRNGQSMVPVYLSELHDRANDVKAHDIEALLSALFEIHDEIDLERDEAKGFYAMENTSLRYHWLIRTLTRKRFDIQERATLFLSALQNSSFRWFIEFVRSACNEYRPSDDRGPVDPSGNLVRESDLPELKVRARDWLRAAAQDGKLYEQRNLAHLLYRWRDFELGTVLGEHQRTTASPDERGISDGDPDLVRAWTDSLIVNDAGLLRLAHAFAGESWSFSDGDHVSRPSMSVQLRDDAEIVDTDGLRSGLETLLKNETGTEEENAFLQAFLKAWDAERKQRDHKDPRSSRAAANDRPAEADDSIEDGEPEFDVSQFDEKGDDELANS